jgi:hypothetical protein
MPRRRSFARELRSATRTRTSRRASATARSGGRASGRLAPHPGPEASATRSPRRVDASPTTSNLGLRSRSSRA